MKILLVKPRHIGDSLLMTPTIRAIRNHYPTAQIWVIVRSSCEGILHGCPDIDRIITTSRPESGKRKFSSWLKDIKGLLEIRKEKFDYAIDLGESIRGRWITLFSGARQKISSFSAHKNPPLWDLLFTKNLSFQNYLGHAAVKDFQTVSSVIHIGQETPPLVFDRSKTVPCSLVPENSRIAFLHPTTRWKRKQWTTDKWLQLCNQLQKSFDYLIISTGKDSSELSLAYELREKCASSKIILTEGNLSWAESADLLYRSQLYIGVDTAMSHLAAACQCPSIVLFGATYEGAWRPWKVPHRIILPPGCIELSDAIPLDVIAKHTERKTSDIRLEDVLAAARTLVPNIQ